MVSKVTSKHTRSVYKSKLKHDFIFVNFKVDDKLGKDSLNTSVRSPVFFFAGLSLHTHKKLYKLKGIVGQRFFRIISTRCKNKPNLAQFSKQRIMFLYRHLKVMFLYRHLKTKGVLQIPSRRYLRIRLSQVLSRLAPTIAQSTTSFL